MIFVWRAVLVMCIIFAGCMLGVLLQHLLPTQHITDAKSAITTIQGLVALLLALVLGLLVWTSYGVYSQQQSEAHTLGSQILQLDLALERYGPDGRSRPRTARARAYRHPRAVLGRRRRRTGADDLWPVARRVARLRRIFRRPQAFDDEQRRQLDMARQLSTSIVQTHYLMSRQLRNPFPKALLISVVCWATLVFTCVGALSSVNALSIVYEALGAASVASAIYLILEFSQPYVGLFRIPSEGIDQVIASLSPTSRAASDGRRPPDVRPARRRSHSPSPKRDCDAGHSVPPRAMLKSDRTRKGESLIETQSPPRLAAVGEVS